MNISGLGYLGVESPAHKEWTTFGPEVLGTPVTEVGDDGTVFLRVDERHHRIAIHPGPEDRFVYAGWELPGEADLDEAVERLTAAGVEVRHGTEAECAVRRVERFVAFTDPAGLPHELFYGQLVCYEPFVPGRPISGFMTAAQGLGHVVFIVPDAKAAHEFYSRVLGFRLSDIVDTQFHTPGYFYHCNSRHHSVAVLEVPEMAGFHHLMLEVNEFDDVGVAYDIVRSREIQLSMELGRHSTDRMVSFYMVTPSGFEIEYGWGGRQVDESTWRVVRADRGEIWGHHYVGKGLPATIKKTA